MMHHEVKSWVHLFKPILDGRKTYDLRKNDRNYRVGDTVRLMEYDPEAGRFTGMGCLVEVTYITNDVTPCAVSSAVLPHEYCILGYKRL